MHTDRSSRLDRNTACRDWERRTAIYAAYNTSKVLRKCHIDPPLPEIPSHEEADSEGHIMRIASVLFITGLMSSSALAADLLEPVVPVEPVPVIEEVPAFTWTGFYAGVDLGWAFSAND